MDRKFGRNVDDCIISMGNIVEKIASNKVETLLLAAIASSGYLLYQQHQ